MENSTIIIIVVLIVILLFTSTCLNKKKIQENYHHHHVHHRHPFRKFTRRAKHTVGRIKHQLSHPTTNLVPNDFKNKIDKNAVFATKQLNAISHIGSISTHIDNFIEVHGIDALNKSFNQLEDNVRKSVINKWDGFKNFTERIGQSVENLNNHIIGTLGKVLNKIGEEEMLLLKSLLDPCAYLLPYGCPLLVSSLAGQLEAAFAEEEIEEEAEFDAMATAIKTAIETLESKVAYLTAQSMVNALMVPLIAPMLTLALHTISNDQSFIDEVSPQVCHMVSTVLTQLIVEQDGLLVYSMIVIQYCTALMCTGVFYDIPVDEFIPGYTPYVYKAANALGINCNKKKTEHGYDQHKYDKLNNENKDYIIVKDGTCESHGHKSLKSVDKCKLAGEFHGYGSNMGPDNLGNVTNQSGPHGCVFKHKTGNQYEAQMFPNGQELCSDSNQCVCMKDQSDKPNSIIINNGASCEASGYKTIMEPDRCLKELRLQGRSGMDVPYDLVKKDGKVIGTKPHWNARAGDNRPWGCSTLNDKKQRGTYEVRKSGDCGVNGYDCICDNKKLNTKYDPDLKLDDIDGTSKVTNTINVIDKKGDYVKIKGSSCDFANLQHIGPSRCEDAAKQYGKIYNGILRTNDYSFGAPGCAYDKDSDKFNYYEKGIFCGPNMDCVCKDIEKPLSNVEKSQVTSGTCAQGINNIEINDESKCKAYASKLNLNYGGVDDTIHYSSGNNSYHKAQCGYDTESHEVKFYSHGLDCNDKQNCLCADQEINTTKAIDTATGSTEILDKNSCSFHNLNDVNSKDKCEKIASAYGKKFGGEDRTQKYTNSNPGCGYDTKQNEVKFYIHGLDCSNEDDVNCICNEVKDPITVPNPVSVTNKINSDFTEVLDSEVCNKHSLYEINNPERCKIAANSYKKEYGGEDETMKYSDFNAGCGYDILHNKVKFYKNGLNCNNNDKVNCLCNNNEPPTNKISDNYTEIIDKNMCNVHKVYSINESQKCQKAASDFGKDFTGNDDTRKYAHSKPGCGYDKMLDHVKYYQNGLDCNNNDNINCICDNNEPVKPIITTSKIGDKYTEILDDQKCTSHSVFNVKNENTCKDIANQYGKTYGGLSKSYNQKDTTSSCVYDTQQDKVYFYPEGGRVPCYEDSNANCLCSDIDPSTLKNYKSIGNKYSEILDNTSCSTNKISIIPNSDTCKQVASDYGKTFDGVDGTRKYNNSLPGCGHDTHRDSIKYYKNGLNCNNNDGVNCICSNNVIKTTQNIDNKFTEILDNSSCSTNDVFTVTDSDKCSELASAYGKKYDGIDGTRKYSNSNPGCGHDTHRDSIKFYKSGLDCNNTDGVNCLCSNNETFEPFDNMSDNTFDKRFDDLSFYKI